MTSLLPATEQLTPEPITQSSAGDLTVLQVLLPPSDIPSGIFTTEADKGSWDAETLVDVDEFGSAKDAAPSLKDSELVLGKLAAASHNEVVDAQLDALTEAELDARLRATVARAASTAEPGTPSQTPLSGSGRIGALTQGAGDQLDTYLAAATCSSTAVPPCWARPTTARTRACSSPPPWRWWPTIRSRTCSAPTTRTAGGGATPSPPPADCYPT